MESPNLEPMERRALLLFPNTLYTPEQLSAQLRTDEQVFLIESPFFFHPEGPEPQIRFHKKKLVLHRASLKACERMWQDRGYRVRYLDHQDLLGDDAPLARHLKSVGVDRVSAIRPTHRALEQAVGKELEEASIGLTWLPSPGFLSPDDWALAHFRSAKHYAMTPFYRAQRLRMGILLDPAGNPTGGKWTYDTENRSPISADTHLPPPPPPIQAPHIDEAARYVDRHFPNHPGRTEGFNYPITHGDASRWLDDFLHQRLACFGKYEDAILESQPVLFHSVLSSSLNIGLLTPAQVVDRTLAHAAAHPIPLNSLEGFLRQIIGWREFIRIVYLMEGERQRQSNHFNHQRPLPRAVYAGETGLHPVDLVLRRVQETAYVHHIERLMVLGNFMLLCNIAPGEVYRWFMEMFIDAYDWVMVPNVFGMSQFSDGGLMSTKPYISSSNYLLKMSDLGRGDWAPVWDGLYWHFVDRHINLLARIPRQGWLGASLRRMNPQKLEAHRARATRYLDSM